MDSSMQGYVTKSSFHESLSDFVYVSFCISNFSDDGSTAPSGNLLRGDVALQAQTVDVGFRRLLEPSQAFGIVLQPPGI